METAEFWRRLFSDWPADIERRGAVLSKEGEALGFDNFVISEGLLLLERNAPDASGARKAFIAYDSIAIVKLPTVIELSQFHQLGFQPPSSAGVGQSLTAADADF